MNCSIYKITNLITNQIYIGKTIDYHRREKEYIKLKCKSQKLLYKSIKHYTWNNHKFEVICTCINEISDKLEIFFIAHYNSYYYNNKKVGLNLTKGGDNPPRMPGKLNPMYGKTHTKETREKISESRKGKISPQKGKKLFGKGLENIILSNKNRQIEIHQLSITNGYIKTFIGIKEASRITGIDDSLIIKCCKGKNKTAGGFKWKYAINTTI